MRIFTNEDACMGCKLCEVHCKVEHSRSKDIFRSQDEQPSPQRRVFVEAAGPVTYASICQQCEDPACVKACLNRAMWKHDVTGVVFVDTERCIGCWTCVAVCPYGAVWPSPTKKAVKCDLCPEREDPACVANCPNEALQLVQASA